MEKRLIKTHLSKKPLPAAFKVSAGMLLLSTLFSFLYWRVDPISSLLGANKILVFQGQIWRLFTTTLVHGSMKHLLSNAYMLGILSYFVFGYFRWTTYPLVAFLFSGLVNLFTLQSMPESTYLIGASGMVYWLAGFWLTIYIFIERQHSLTQRIVRSLGVALVTLFPSTLEPQVSYKAHAIGFLLGFLYAIFYFFSNKKTIRQSEEWKIIYDEEDMVPYF